MVIANAAGDANPIQLAIGTLQQDVKKVMGFQSSINTNFFALCRDVISVFPTFALNLWFPCLTTVEQPQNRYRTEGHIYLDMSNGYQWQMKKAADVALSGNTLSQPDGRPASDWLTAIVPGTVLNSLVYNKVYPEPSACEAPT